MQRFPRSPHKYKSGPVPFNRPKQSGTEISRLRLYSTFLIHSSKNLRTLRVPWMPTIFKSKYWSPHFILLFCKISGFSLIGIFLAPYSDNMRTSLELSPHTHLGTPPELFSGHTHFSPGTHRFRLNFSRVLILSSTMACLFITTSTWALLSLTPQHVEFGMNLILILCKHGI